MIQSINQSINQAIKFQNWTFTGLLTDGTHFEVQGLHISRGGDEKLSPK